MGRAGDRRDVPVVPDAFQDLFDAQSFAHFATLSPDGLPHVTPVWVDYDADANRLEVNTVRGRRKERNVRADPRVGLSVLDPDNAYRYLSVEGEVTETTTEGAVAHIDALARRYMGVDRYPNHDEEAGDRVILRIRPERIHTSGA